MTPHKYRKYLYCPLTWVITLNIYQLFKPHLIHACEIWGQKQNNKLFQRISHLQEKALCIINFKLHDTFTDPLFKEDKVLKI